MGEITAIKLTLAEARALLSLLKSLDPFEPPNFDFQRQDIDYFIEKLTALLKKP